MVNNYSTRPFETGLFAGSSNGMYTFTEFLAAEMKNANLLIGTLLPSQVEKAISDFSHALTTK